MTEQYDTWKQLLDLKKANPTVNGMRQAIDASGIKVLEIEPFSGFYRTRRVKNGPLEPVAIWRDEADNLIVFCGADQVDLERVWPYCVWNPIPHDWYEAVVERNEGWPDMDRTVAAQVDDDGMREKLGGNEPPDELTLLKDQIESAKAGAADYAKIEDDEKQAQAQSLRSRLLELSGSADKKREAEKRPHFDAAKAADAKWMPLVKMAKDAADAIRSAMNVWENAKLAREREERAKAEAERRRIEDENRRAAEKAAAENRPPPAPVEPPPAASPPATPTSIKGGYGRAAGVKKREVAIITNLDAAYAHFKAIPEVKELIQKLAQRAVDAGRKDIPGVSIEEQRNVA